MAWQWNTIEKGEIVHLDNMYELQGIIPEEATVTCFEDGTPDGEDGFGDYRKFVKTVKYRYEVKVID